MFTAPPNIVSDPLSMTVEEGARASLACQFHAMAHPVTVVLWKKNGKMINEDGSRIKMNKADGTLVISEVELDDHGNYSCLVNTTGFKPVHSKPAIVLVKGKTHVHELLCHSNERLAGIDRWLTKEWTFLWDVQIFL